MSTFRTFGLDSELVPSFFFHYSDADALTLFLLGPLNFCLVDDVSPFGDFWNLPAAISVSGVHSIVSGAKNVFRTVDVNFWLRLMSPFYEFFPDSLLKTYIGMFENSSDRLYLFVFCRSVPQTAKSILFVRHHNECDPLSLCSLWPVQGGICSSNWNFQVFQWDG